MLLNKIQNSVQRLKVCDERIGGFKGIDKKLSGVQHEEWENMKVSET